MPGPKTVSEEARIAGEINNGGVTYLRDLLKTQAGANSLMAVIGDKSVQISLAKALIQEGSRMLAEHKASGKPISEIPKMASPIGEMLKDSDMRKRLREMMVTPQGRNILNAVVSTTEGDFLTLGYLFNAPGGKSMVARMMLSAEGRQTAFTIIGAATKAAPDPYYLPKLAPFIPTADGKRLREDIMVDTDNFIAGLSTHAGKRNLLEVFTKKTTEVRSILRELVSSDEGVERLKKLMVSEQGRDFLSMLGSIGRQIAGDDLWLTAGGRKLVRELLKTGDGRSALFSLVSGF